MQGPVSRSGTRRAISGRARQLASLRCQGFDVVCTPMRDIKVYRRGLPNDMEVIPDGCATVQIYEESDR